MTTGKVHLDVSSGLNEITLCGRSLHGWNLKRPKYWTTERLEVTCKNCLRLLGMR